MGAERNKRFVVGNCGLASTSFAGSSIRPWSFASGAVHAGVKLPGVGTFPTLLNPNALGSSETRFVCLGTPPRKPARAATEITSRKEIY